MFPISQPSSTCMQDEMAASGGKPFRETCYGCSTRPLHLRAGDGIWAKLSAAQPDSLFDVVRQTMTRARLLSRPGESPLSQGCGPSKNLQSHMQMNGVQVKITGMCFFRPCLGETLNGCSFVQFAPRGWEVVESVSLAVFGGETLCSCTHFTSTITQSVYVLG